MKRYMTMILSLLLAAGIGSACYILVLQKQVASDAALTAGQEPPRPAGTRQKAASRERPRVSPPVEKLPEDTIFFTGFVRGRSQLTLKNKYAGFVSKVNV